jgi:hypothetical protein
VNCRTRVRLRAFLFGVASLLGWVEFSAVFALSVWIFVTAVRSLLQ